MSALGITFAVLALSWIVGRITSNINHPMADLIYIVCVLIFGGALLTGIVLLGFML
jgi:predicted RNA-binding protein with EMAP domain